MPGLDYIPRFEEGGDVEPTQTPTTPLSAKPVVSKSKYALPTSTGATGVDESILQRMQEIINQREAQKGSFMESLKDATAWWSGGMAGPGEALARRAKEREEQEATTFGMRRDLAQYRVSQEQARNLDKQLFGAPQAAAPTQPGAAGVTQPGAAQPAAGGVQAPAQTGGLLNLVKDAGLRQSIAVQAQSGDRQGAMKAIQTYLAKNAEDPVLVKELRFMIDNKLIDPKLIPAAVLTKFVGSGAFVPQDVRGPSGTMQTTPLGAAGAVSPTVATVPGVTTTKPAAAPAAAPTPTAAPAAAAPAATSTPAAAPSPTTGPQPIPQVQPLPKVGAPTATAPAKPAATGAGGFAPGSKEELEVRKAGAEKEAQETATDVAKDRAATVEAGSNAGERLASIQYLNNLVTTNPRAFGVLQKPGVLTAVLGAAEQGANVGNLGAVGIAGISDAVRKAMPGATQADIDAAQKASREFALMQLNAAKIYLKGQGAVSDAERGLIRELAGSIKNSPEAIRDFLKWNQMRAEFDKKNGAAYREFNRKNPNVSFERYKESEEYQKLKTEYENNLNQFVKSSSAPKTDVRTHPGAQLLNKYPAKR
jgi:hypothetical protein